MVTTPAMLRGLITRLARGRVDLDVVATLKDRDELVHNLQTLRPELVVIGLTTHETGSAIHPLLELLPVTKFVALSADGREIVGYQRCFAPTSLGDASPQALIDFLRRTSKI
jgi:DNA-binding NarL/FixJ family response regulator